MVPPAPSVRKTPTDLPIGQSDGSSSSTGVLSPGDSSLWQVGRKLASVLRMDVCKSSVSIIDLEVCICLVSGGQKGIRSNATGARDNYEPLCM